MSLLFIQIASFVSEKLKQNENEIGDATDAKKAENFLKYKTFFLVYCDYHNH